MSSKYLSSLLSVPINICHQCFTQRFLAVAWVTTEGGRNRKQMLCLKEVSDPIENISLFS